LPVNGTEFASGVAMLSPYQRIRNRDQRKISASIDQTPLTNKTKHFWLSGAHASGAHYRATVRLKLTRRRFYRASSAVA
jgi:hypothetical protein